MYCAAAPVQRDAATVLFELEKRAPANGISRNRLAGGNTCRSRKPDQIVGRERYHLVVTTAAAFIA